VILRTCVCGRICPPGTNRCPLHAIQRDNGHSRRKRIAREVLAQEHTCWICGHPERPGDPLTIDHLIPVAYGGTTTRENLRAAHRSCNSRRGASLVR
jgi:5-methylcytosine-specific restriction endonuclease McrA